MALPTARRTFLGATAGAMIGLSLRSSPAARGRSSHPDADERIGAPAREGGVVGRTDARVPGAHRAIRRAAQCVHHGHRRPGAGRGRATWMPPCGVATGEDRCTASRSRSRTTSTRRASGRPPRASVFKDRVPTDDADIVARLKRAGAIVIGKTNLHEFALRWKFVGQSFRAGAQPMGARSRAGRIVRRFGGRRRRGPVFRRVRDRHRGVDSHARLVLRHRRPETDLRPRQQSRRHSAVVDPRSRRPAVQDGRRCGACCSG